MPTLTTNLDFDPAQVYTQLPAAVLRALNLSNLPLPRKQKLIAEIQARIDEVAQNLLLALLSEDANLTELENLLLADEEVNGDELLAHLLRTAPDFFLRWQTECKNLFNHLIH